MRLPAAVLEHLASPLGVLLRRDMVAAGIDDRAILRRRRAGEIVRLRHGAYVLTPAWHAADTRTRHLMLTEAVLDLFRDDIALSHVSAAISYGAPDWRVPLADAHVTSLSRTGQRNRARVQHHRGECGVLDLTRHAGHWMTSPARTALDSASILPRDAAVCTIDWFLEEGLTSMDELLMLLDGRQTWSDHLDLSHKVSLASVGSQSVGETRSRLLFGDRGLPAPVLQLAIREPSGRLVGIVDFAWPERRLIVEFDGVTKYHRHRRPGESIEEMVVREKFREDRIRELTGWTVVRIVWADLARPDLLVPRLHRHLLHAA
jgi:hypothetical protein